MNTSSSPPDPVEIRAQLERILESASFRGSRRSSDFLRYVIEGAIEGRFDSLKERSIGAAVFERPPDYDTNQDPVVRNAAGQVRKRLAQYYYEPGHEGELRVDLPPGSYLPEITRPVVRAAEPALAPEPPAVEAPPKQPRFTRPWLLGAIAVLAAAAILLVWQRRARPSDLQQFWAPLLEPPGPIVLCVGQGHPYRLTGDWDRRFEAGNPSPELTIPLKDVTPMWDRYIGVSDAQAMLRFTTLFARSGKDVQLRGGRTTSLTDLRRRPVVLIGAFNNDWTLSLTGELRFYFESEPARNLDFVRDRSHPEQRAWAVRSDLAITQIPTDYAIVTRVFSRTTEQAVVVAAGIKGAGTAAAGEFLTNPSYLTQALAAAPADWGRKNVQFVLAAKMFSGSPGPPVVVASHYW